jgi:hypothetical protein
VPRTSECAAHAAAAPDGCVLERCAHAGGRAIVQYRNEGTGGWTVLFSADEGTVGFPKVSPDAAWAYWLHRLTDGRLGSREHPPTWPAHDVPAYDLELTVADVTRATPRLIGRRCRSGAGARGGSGRWRRSGRGS